MTNIEYTLPIRESVLTDLKDVDSFVPTAEQKKAIDHRDYNKARRLGLNLNQYLYYISPRYRSKLCALI